LLSPMVKGWQNLKNGGFCHEPQTIGLVITK
jgi:hypothetical protein